MTYRRILTTFLLQLPDDDQGETLILAVVVDAPTGNIREVQICSKVREEGAERIHLLLGPGDGYSMDGEFSSATSFYVLEAYHHTFLSSVH